MEYEHIIHSFDPVYDKNSRILILGSLPSVRSREQGFYYGHPRNRFWKVTAALCRKAVPDTVEEKTAMLLGAGIAVWDVVAECDIAGSADSKIRNVKPTDLSVILSKSPISAVYANGSTAAALYRKYQQQITGMEITALPSTSPANAAWSEERLITEWKSRIALDETDSTRKENS